MTSTTSPDGRSEFLRQLLEIRQDPQVRSLARRRAVSLDLAEDALQEAYYAVAKVKNPGQISNLRAYFCRVLVRKADELRDEKGPRSAHACALDDAKVRFFGEDVAIIYGSEHAIGKDKTHPDAKQCQVWTDIWLKRDGKWQIAASQDNKVDCK